MIGRPAAGYLFFQRRRHADGAKQTARDHGKDRAYDDRADGRSAGRANKFEMRSIKKAPHRCLPCSEQSNMIPRGWRSRCLLGSISIAFAAPHLNAVSGDRIRPQNIRRLRQRS
jgi:hypothetical protein